MARISDKPKKLYNRKAQSTGIPLVSLADAQVGDNRVNDHLTSGVGYGRVVFIYGLLNAGVSPLVVATMYMKRTYEPEANWTSLNPNVSVTQEITPSAYTLANTRKRSDSKPKALLGDSINSTKFPVVAVADLLDRGHPINQNHISGKTRYGCVIGADETDPDPANWTYKFYIATGLEDNSTWVDLSDVAITPVGTAMAVDGNLRSDRKRKMYNARVVSLHTAVVTEAEIIDATAGPNVYGKGLGSSFLAVDDLDAPTVYRIVVATGTAPTDVWYNLNGDAVYTPV